MLKEVGKDLLVQFCARFQAELAARNIKLPPPDLPDDAYLQSLATLLKAPALLPVSFKDALFEIEQWASPLSSGNLKEAAAKAGLQSILEQGHCHERLALQLWLARPAFVLEDEKIKKHLTPFEGFGSAVEKTEGVPLTLPPAATLEEMKARMHLWFRQRNPNAPKVVIEIQVNKPGEIWFLLRHGDTCRWIYNLKEEKVELMHFRHEQEDAVLYLPGQRQIWITAGTKEDREMYRQQFSLYLQGDPDYFCLRCAFCLDRLQTDGVDAIEPLPQDGITAIKFSRDEVEWRGGGHELTINKAGDIFQAAKTIGADTTFIPKTGTLTRARFKIQFEEGGRWRVAEIRPPGLLKLENAEDLATVVRWFSKRGFLLPQPHSPNALSNAA